MIRRTLMVAGLALAALAGCGRKGPSGAYGGEAKPIVFSILSAETQASMGSISAPVLDDLHKKTGLTVKPYFASNYSGLIEAMRAHQVQMGWFSALPALRRRAGPAGR